MRVDRSLAFILYQALVQYDAVAVCSLRPA